jgi:hypothetical protein
MGFGPRFEVRLAPEFLFGALSSSSPAATCAPLPDKAYPGAAAPEHHSTRDKQIACERLHGGACSIGCPRSSRR